MKNFRSCAPREVAEAFEIGDRDLNDVRESGRIPPAQNCFSKIVVSLSRFESARFSVRLLARNFFTALCTVTSSGARGGASLARIEAACSSAASSSCLRLSSAFSQLRV